MIHLPVFLLPLVSGGLALLALHFPWSSGAPDDDPPVDAQEVEEAPGAEREAEPGRRRAIAGLGGLWCASTLTLAAFPDDPQRVEMTYVFPGRARWRMAPAKGSDDPLRRRMWYRWGTSFWRVEAGAQVSHSPPREERARNLLQLELRRVALIWPADLDWKGSATEKRAVLKGLGELRAQLDEKTGRPSALEFRVSEAGDRPPDERLEKIRWRKEKERHWPSSWTIVVGTEAVAGEVIEELRPGARYLDAYFKPLDRRERGASRRPAEPREVKLTPRIVRRTSLKTGTEWKDALLAADEELARWGERFEGSSWKLSPRAAFQLDLEGRPIGIELRLLGEPEGQPEGWKRVEGGEGLSILLEELSGVNGALLAELSALVPPEHRAGAPYARVQRTPEGGVGLVQLVLPIVAAK